MVYFASLIKNVNHFKSVSACTCIIVVIVGRCDLYSTGSEVHVDQHVISYHFDFAVRAEGMLQLFTNQIFVARILWVDSNCNVTKHGLQTSGRNDDLLVSSFYFVNKLSQSTEFVPLFGIVTWDLQFCRTFQIGVLNFKIRKRSTKVT